MSPADAWARVGVSRSERSGSASTQSQTLSTHSYYLPYIAHLYDHPLLSFLYGYV